MYTGLKFSTRIIDMNGSLRSALAVSFGLIFAKANNDILRFLGLVSQVVLKNALGTVGIASLSIEGGTRIVRHHSVSTAEGVLHCAPDVILGSRLDVPNITRISRQLTTLESLSNSIFVADGTTSSVNEPGALLEVFQKFSVDESPCSFVQRAIDCNNITL